MFIQSERLQIRELTMEMCRDYQQNSLDEDNRRFVPDEVCETLEEAEKTLRWLIASYGTENGPFVYPLFTQDNQNIGYVQACPLGKEKEFEIGYHIAQRYTGNGYVAEAVRAFLPVILQQLQIDHMNGIVLEENAASRRVLEKTGFQLAFRGIAKYQGQDRALREYIFNR